MEDLLHNYYISQLTLAPGIVTADNTALRDVINLMLEKKVGCVITYKAHSMSSKTITGIFTERDLLEKVIDEDVDWSSPIQQFTTPSPEIMRSDELLRKALYLMRKKNFRHIPIFESSGELRGVLSIRNLVKLFAEHFPIEVMNLPPRLKKVPTTPEGG